VSYEELVKVVKEKIAKLLVEKVKEKEERKK